MRHIIRNSIFLIALMVLAAGAIFPTDKNLRLGKDLRGGATLTYSVSVEQGDDPKAVLDQTISVLKDRVDPNGVLEVQMVAQGRDRIEITMPLPNERTLALKGAYEDALAELESTSITADAVERAMRASGEERINAINNVAGENAEARQAMLDAAARYDAAQTARGLYDQANANEANAPEALEELAAAVATAELAYEDARDAALSEGLSPNRLDRALRLSDETKRLKDLEADASTDGYVVFPSPRDRAVTEIRESFPTLSAKIDTAIAAFEAYIAERSGLDDPEELKRLVQAAGVPAFRITVSPGGPAADNGHPEEDRLRRDLQEKGPRNVRSRDSIWCKVNQIENWFDSVQDYDRLRAAPAGYFGQRYGLVAEEYDGEYWVLCWDAKGKRLSNEDGQWSVAGSFPTQDEAGRPAIGFTMDARGARKLGDLTGDNQGNQMAVLLDEQVYTAPTLQSRISAQGRITGGSSGFSQEELDYIVRVLTAGSLQARLSPEPVSQNTIAPEFGLDNLVSGRNAGLIALAAVSAFMVFYYFTYGVVAVLSLIVNAVLILAAMSLARAAFTLPGIAGVILTFGMAVDANVLIYERIREELRKGEDLRTAVRLGYQKALSSIVDGNVTNLIVCFVLASPQLGTQEIRGFAITLGIGVVCTLFSALFVSRLLLALLVDTMKVKKLSMLPMALPALEKILEPKINWIGLRWVFVGISTAAVSLGIFMVISQGEKMLDAEFRGGTQVEFRLRPATAADTADVSDEGNITLTRADIETSVRALAEGLGDTDPLRPLVNAEVIAVDPEPGGVRSDRFIIKTYATNQEAVLSAIVDALGNNLESQPRIEFKASAVDTPSGTDGIIFPIGQSRLGEAIGRPQYRNDVTPFIGGVAIILEDISPAVDLNQIKERVRRARGAAIFSGALGRTVDFMVLEGATDAVRTIALVVHDEGQSYFDDPDGWEANLAKQEWEIVRTALTSPAVSASVQNFSPVVAARFQQQAIVSIFLSLLLILIYIWVRFGSVRYSMAAIVTLLHDVLFAVGLIAMAEIVYENEVTEPFARALGIEPFKIDLNLVAAILTIIGYSLNDTIIIMDRIRENRGKLPYASKEVVNLSINQTISRTVITSGTTLIATLILYSFGGSGVRAFSYALLVGVAIGTYSSIAVASPLVWSGKADGSRGRPKRGHDEPSDTDGIVRIP